MSISRLSRPHRLLAAGLFSAALIGLAPATGFAKEIGSGGATGGVTTPTCSPVSSLVVKGDAKTAETGLASIAVSYGVKPCTNGQAVMASVTVSEYLNPSVVVYDNPGAPLNGKFTVFGVRLSTSYKVTVTVVDTATGTIAGSQSAYVAAVPRGV